MKTVMSILSSFVSLFCALVVIASLMFLGIAVDLIESSRAENGFIFATGRVSCVFLGANGGGIVGGIIDYDCMSRHIRREGEPRLSVVIPELPAMARVHLEHRKS